MLTSFGKEVELIMRAKFSLSSNVRSLVIEIGNEISVILGGKVAMYGPET